MDAIIAIIMLQIEARDYVPSTLAERVVWLDAHGVPPTVTAVTVEATLSAWARCGATIAVDGSVEVLRYHPAYAPLLARAVTRLAAGERDVALSEVDVVAVAEDLERTEAELAATRRIEAEASAARRAERVIAFRARGIDALLIRTNTGRWEAPSRYEDRASAVREALGEDAYDRASAEADARNAAIDAAVEEARVLYLAALREIAVTVESLTRPAAEGYDIERATLDHLAAMLAINVGGEYEIDTASWTDLEDRAAPNAAAFTLLDRVTANVAVANSTLPAAIGTWVISRIVRIDVCPHQGNRHPVTCVLATLATPVGIREITWSTESLACGHEDIDED